MFTMLKEFIKSVKKAEAIFSWISLFLWLNFKHNFENYKDHVINIFLLENYPSSSSKIINGCASESSCSNASSLFSKHIFYLSLRWLPDAANFVNAFLVIMFYETHFVIFYACYCKMRECLRFFNWLKVGKVSWNTHTHICIYIYLFVYIL